LDWYEPPLTGRTAVFLTQSFFGPMGVAEVIWRRVNVVRVRPVNRERMEGMTKESVLIDRIGDFWCESWSFFDSWEERSEKGNKRRRFD